MGGRNMIEHSDIWNTLDAIAEHGRVSPSRMAINCGLDATTFNKSKRCDVYGKNRYPSFRTVLKVLNTRNMTMVEFGTICDRICAQRSQS